MTDVDERTRKQQAMSNKYYYDEIMKLFSTHIYITVKSRSSSASASFFYHFKHINVINIPPETL